MIGGLSGCIPSLEEMIDCIRARSLAEHLHCEMLTKSVASGTVTPGTTVQASWKHATEIQAINLGLTCNTIINIKN